MHLKYLEEYLKNSKWSINAELIKQKFNRLDRHLTLKYITRKCEKRPARCGCLLGIVLQSERSWVSLIRACPWVADWALVGACMRGNRLMFLSHIEVSLPLFPSL